MRALSLWVPVALYMAAIFYVSSLPDPPMPTQVTDKPLHWLAYGGLAVLMVRAIAGGLPARVDRRIATLAVLVTLGYGASDELHQMFVPGRSAEWLDLVADAVGALCGTSACWAWGIISSVRSRSGTPSR